MAREVSAGERSRRRRARRAGAYPRLTVPLLQRGSPVESGGDLTEPLLPCSLSLTYRGMGPRSATRNGPSLRADQAADEMNVTMRADRV